MRDEKFDQERGTLKDAGGKVERGAGDLVGDDQLRAKGTEDQAEGKAQNLFGKAKEAVGKAGEAVKDAVNPDKPTANTDK